MLPQHLFEAWPKLVAELDGSRTVCLLLDFDGTLSPFAKEPGLARLPAATKGSLMALSSNARFRVGVISGRSLEDIRRMVDLPGLFYAGNHGLEIDCPGASYVHPDARETEAEVRLVAARLGRALGSYEGVIVEDKGLTASVHYRNLSEEHVSTLLRLVEGEAKRHRGLVFRRGKKVVEIRPNLDWGKGKASEAILGGMGKGCVPIYVGDDETDEEAFASQMIYWTVRVMDEDAPTRARYRLNSVDEVQDFLGRLVRWSADAHC